MNLTTSRAIFIFAPMLLILSVGPVLSNLLKAWGWL